jgi:hypothetical protein
MNARAALTGSCCVSRIQHSIDSVTDLSEGSLAQRAAVNLLDYDFGLFLWTIDQD